MPLDWKMGVPVVGSVIFSMSVMSPALSGNMPSVEMYKGRIGKYPLPHLPLEAIPGESMNKVTIILKTRLIFFSCCGLTPPVSL